MFGIDASQKFLEHYGLHIDLFRHLLIGGLIFTRIFIMTMFIPFFGARPIPGRVRVSLSVALMIFFFSPVSAMAKGELPTAGTVIFTLFFKEVLFAILLGFAAGMVFYGIQAAGNVVDNQRQLANAQIFNPAVGAQVSLFGIFFYQLSIVLFILIGGHRMILGALGHSFETVPVLGFPNIHQGVQPILELMMHLAADTLVIALQLAAPVLVAIFIADIILGLTNRVAPMVNVFEMGFNIKGFLGVLLVYLSLPLVIYQMKEWFLHYMHSLQHVVDFFVR